MLVVGLTGGIACGKTTVSNMFSDLGVSIIDTDIIAHQLVEPGKPATTEIATQLGSELIMPDGQLDRIKLADLTFNNTSNKKILEAILHPAIKKVMLKQIKAVKDKYCIAVIPLLFETGQNKLVDRILVVDCKQEQQFTRVQNRDQREQSQIQAIIDSQVSRETRLMLADDVIDNHNNIKHLSVQVNNLHKKYLKLSS